ncbi:MAG: SRPBCC domain-containing protein [Acidobacteria bacterium]|nr:SRPBCC domain-containing protein [Acidobacteriota bacterium]
MTQTAADTISVVVERDFASPPEKLWRALTTPHLIEQWLLKTDFEPVLGRPFKLIGDWGTVDCRVLEIEPHQKLVYSWSVFGAETRVALTLTKTTGGAHLRVEQSGFGAGPEHRRFVQGAQAGWSANLAKLQDVLDREA